MGRLSEIDVARARTLVAALEDARDKLGPTAAGSATARFVGIQSELAAAVPRLLEELDEVKRERDEALEAATKTAPQRRR